MPIGAKYIKSPEARQMVPEGESTYYPLSPYYPPYPPYPYPYPYYYSPPLKRETCYYYCRRRRYLLE